MGARYLRAAIAVACAGCAADNTRSPEAHLAIGPAPVGSISVGRAREAEMLDHAFHATGGAFVADGRTHRALVRDGRIELTPYTFERGERTVHAAVSFETAAPAGASTASAGAIAIDRAGLREELRDELGGLHQQWTIETAPPGGDLVVEVTVAGGAYAGTTDAGIHFASDGAFVRYSHATWISGDGRQWAVPAVFDADSGRIRMSVPARVIAVTQFPATLDPTISAESAVDVPVIAPTAALQQHAAIAFGGGIYLAVWQDDRDSPASDIWAARLGADGTILDPLGILIAAGPGTQSTPAVAYDGSSFVVAWEDFKVVGGTEADVVSARVSTDGVVTAIGTVAGTAADERDPRVASRGDGTALVVWNAAGVVDGALVGSAVSPAFTIASGATVDLPALAANPTGDFLVAWSASNAVQAQLVTGGGALDGAPFALSAATGTQTQPSAAFDGTNFDVIWTVQGRYIYGSRVTPAGSVLDKRTVGTSVVGGIAISSSTAQAAHAQVACQASGCFVVWHDVRNTSTTGWDLYAQLLASDFTRSGTEIAFSTAPGAQSWPVVASSGTAYFTAWTDGRDLLAATQIFGATVSSTGAIGTAAVIGTGEDREQTPALGRSGQTLGLFWRDSRSYGPNIYGVRFAASGTQLDPAASAVSAATGAQSLPSASTDLGSAALVVWSDMRNGVDSDIYGARVDLGSGTTLDSGAIALGVAGKDQLAPSVASNGSQALVVWEDRRNGGFDIYGTLVDSTGAVVAASVAICNATGDQVMPAVTWDAADSQFVVLWQDARGGTAAIYGARVASDGTVLDPGGVVLASGAAAQTVPQLASTATQSFAVWQGGTATFGSRVAGGTALSLLDSGLQISSGTSHQRNPAVGILGGAYLVVWNDDRAGNQDLYGRIVGSDGTLRGSELAIATSTDDEVSPVLLATSAAGGSTLLAYEVHREHTSRIATRAISNALESIAVTPATPSIAQGQTQAFVATGTYSDGTTADLTASATWSSATTSVATMAGNVAKAIGVGSSSITATVGSVSGSATLAVTPPVLVDVVIDPVAPTIANGTTQQFTLTAVYSDATTADVTAAAAWASSSVGVATITAGGLATGVAAGSSTIGGSYGGLTDTSLLTVSSATLISIAITPASSTIAKSTTQQFTATGTFSDGTTQDLTALATWTSGNTSVATISSGGLAVGIAAGTSTITAAFAGKTRSTLLTVTPATLTSITVTPATASVAKGFSQQYTATGTFSDGSTQNLTPVVIWTSSATTVATITSGGLATVLSAGTTTITASYAGLSGTATLTGTTATLVSISVTPPSSTISKSGKVQLKATGTFSDGSTLDITTQVSWTSGGKKIATVNGAGRVIAHKAGTVTITAERNGVAGTATVKVTG